MNNSFIEKIYQEHYGLIKLVVKNSIHSPNSDDITSCVQDVFVIAMRKQGLEEHINIKGWLLKTAKNVVNTFNRQKAIREKYCDFSIDLDKVEFITADFSDLLVDQINSERLSGLNLNQIILESLSQNERDFYTLLYLKKLNIKEIGRILNISEGAALTRRTRLKEKIKKVLKNL